MDIVPQQHAQREEMKLFNFGQAGVRALLVEGAPWFVASDVASILGYSSSKDATRLLDDDEKGGHILPTPGGAQEFTIINESGLYSLILRSRRPEAKAFKRWVTAEVLPSIRQTGSYALPQAPVIPGTLSEALQLAADLAREREEVQEQLALAAPKVAAFDTLMDSGSTYLVREAAKLLGLGQTRLYAFMRQQQIIIPGTCEPYQQHIDAGRFVVKTVPYMRGNQQASSKTTHVTTRGLEYLRQRLEKAGAA